MDAVGLEPTMHTMAADLQSADINHSFQLPSKNLKLETVLLVEVRRIELPPARLPAQLARLGHAPPSLLCLAI